MKSANVFQIILMLLVLALLGYTVFGSSQEFFSACRSCRANRMFRSS